MRVRASLLRLAWHEEIKFTFSDLALYWSATTTMTPDQKDYIRFRGG